MEWIVGQEQEERDRQEVLKRFEKEAEERRKEKSRRRREIYRERVGRREEEEEKEGGGQGRVVQSSVVDAQPTARSR